MNKVITSNLCNNCSQEYETLSNNSKFCSTKCRNQAKIKNKIKSENLELLEDYLICKWDNGITLSSMKKYVSNAFGKDKWIEYMNQYPNDLLQPISYTNRTCKHAKAGVHMKTDKFRKQTSQAMTGENNPNHKSKTTEEVRKSRSPFSKDFHKYKTDEDREKFIESVNYEDRLTSTQLEWWIAKFDGDIEKAIKEYKERQTTFSLDICIQKYGKEKGKKRFAERQYKWQKKYKKTNFSKISQELYWSLYEELKLSRYTFYFAQYNKGEKDESGKNHEYSLKLEATSIKPDFFIPELNKIIEFDGVYWHRKNPENISRERKRDEQIKKANYKVLHINERLYKENPEKEIQKCLAFLREEN